MSKSAWISAGKVSAAAAAVALMLGVFFQGQAQQRSDMADVRAELRSGFGAVNGRFLEVNGRLDGISRDLAELRERVATIEGRLGPSRAGDPQANADTRESEPG